MRTQEDSELVSSPAPGRDGRLRSGAVLGRYRILEPLGRGGMSEVYSAYDPQLDRSVALKIMKLERGHEAHTRLQREGRAIARLGHRNVVVVHDVGIYEDELFVAMEHIKGTPLGPWARAPGRTRTEIIAAFVQAGEALAAAHAAGVIHRDFKPANVMVERETDRIVVLDFGLARVQDGPTAPPSGASMLSSTPGASATHSAVGTIGYMAPELMDGDGATESTDQFAFCVSLYEALYGSRPFVGRHAVELLHAMRGEAPSPHDRRGTPSWLHALVQRGLASEPAKRHPSMRALLDELDRRTPPRGGVGWMLGGGLLAAVGGTAWALSSSPTESCAEDDHARLDQVWNTTRRAQTRRALVDGRPHAKDSADRALARIDWFTHAWSEAAASACQRRKTSPASVSSAVDACLNQGLDRLGVAVSVLEDAEENPTIADRAIDLALSLPPMNRCLDEVALPEGGDVSANRNVSEGIARSVAARVTGSAEAAEAASDQAVANSDLASPQLRVDALLERSRVHDSRAHYDDALTDAASALSTSIERELPRRQALASLEMVRLTGDRLRRPNEAQRWETLAHATIQRLPHDALLEARQRWVQGTVRWRGGELDAAAEHLTAAAEAFASAGLLHEQSGALTELGMVSAQRDDPKAARQRLDHVLEIRRQLYGETHPAIADTLADMASIEGRASNTQEALALGLEALKIYEDHVDPSHPHVATIVMNIGLEHRTQGHHDLALEAFARAETIRRQHFGDDHILVAKVLNNRAPSLMALDRLDEARLTLSKALKILEDEHGRDSAELIRTLTNLGNLEAKRDNLERALEHHTRGHEIALETLGPSHAQVGIGAHNLGDLWVQRGRCEQARPYFERALAIFESSLGPDVPEVAYPLTALGECSTQEGQATDAVRLLERALRIRNERDIDPVDRGRTALALAAAHHAVAPGSALAWRTADQALAMFDEAGPAGERQGTDARQWIAEEMGTRPESEKPD